MDAAQNSGARIFCVNRARLLMLLLLLLLLRTFIVVKIAGIRISMDGRGR